MPSVSIRVGIPAALRTAPLREARPRPLSLNSKTTRRSPWPPPDRLGPGVAACHEHGVVGHVVRATPGIDCRCGACGSAPRVSRVTTTRATARAIAEQSGHGYLRDAGMASVLESRPRLPPVGGKWKRRLDMARWLCAYIPLIGARPRGFRSRHAARVSGVSIRRARS